MARTKAAAAMLFAALMHAAPALAGDYPFSGDFTIAGDPEKADPLDARRCALNFFRQGNDGGFTAYHVDLEKFRSTREVNYLVYQRGTCVYDAKAKIESCNMALDTDPGSQGHVYIDVLESVGEAYIRTISFEDVPQAEDYVLKGIKGESFGISYFRCGFDLAKLNAALSDRVSTLAIDARDQLTGPDTQLLEQQDIADLARAMGLEK
jgi:hypothetical protein